MVMSIDDLCKGRNVMYRYYRAYMHNKADEIHAVINQLGSDEHKELFNVDHPYIYLAIRDTGEVNIMTSNSRTRFYTSENEEVSATNMIHILREELKALIGGSLKRGDMVLVRNSYDENWIAAALMNVIRETKPEVVTLYQTFSLDKWRKEDYIFNQCLPLKGNEKLLGTSNEK